MSTEYLCPTCGKTHTVEKRQQAPHRPFCSRRCQLVDLNKWFNEEYRISTPTQPPEHFPDQN